MAVVKLRSTGAVDGNGLLWHYPGTGAVPGRWGEHTLSDGKHMTEGFIALASLPTAASGDEQIQDEFVTIPAGAFIESVEIFVTKEPTTSGSPNLDLGFVKASDRSTEVDFNGLLADADAFETGTDLGAKITYTVGTTEVGAVVGTRLAYTSVISASPSTADWTAGVVRVRIYWYVPLAADV